MKKQIDAMRKLGLSDNEIKLLLEHDKAVDKGENPCPLTAEQEKVSKKMRGSGGSIHKKTDNKPREKKIDNDKILLIKILSEAIKNLGSENIDITNIEREMFFNYNDKKYKIVLSCPRS